MVDKINSESSRLFDVLRGTAALLVVLGHCRHHSAKIFNLPPSGDSIIEKLLLIPSSFGMESVAVFFVLSGFLVGGQTIRLVKNNQFIWLEFLTKRLSRLWTVLLPGIIFTWILIEVSFPRIQNYSDIPTMQAATCNIAFLQESWCSPFLNNDSLWSLSYEFWFYIIFAGITLMVSNIISRHYSAAIVGFSIVLCVLFIFGFKLLFLFPAWLIGAFIAWGGPKLSTFNRVIKRKGYLNVLLSIFFISFFSVISNILGFNKVELTLFVSIPTALFIYVAMYVEGEPRFAKPFIDLGVEIGHRSFSIYVFHLPVAIFLLKLIKDSNWAENLSLPTLTYITFIISIPITLILWKLTEFHTPSVRKFLLAWVLKK